MLIISLVIISGLLIAQSLLTGLVVVRLVRKYNDVVQNFKAFFEQPGPDKPSDFQQVADQLSVIFADRVRIAFQAVDRGARGAAQRDINRGLEDVAVEEMPALAIAQALPKNLKKNPLAEAGLNLLLQRLMSGGIGGGDGSSGRSTQARFNL